MEQARQIDELFEKALGMDADGRRCLLAEADEGMRGDVQRLLHAHESMTDDFLAQPAVLDLPGLDLHELGPGHRVGHYRIERLLGAGGGGTVYAARQEQPNRIVALKVIRGGLTSEAAVARFRDEAEILARLQHPGIAHVYEAGVHKTLPYFVMEYVDGAPLQNVDLDAFARICDAVHHGHLKGVVHRDLKPGNVLIDPEGRPKVIDFGIARADDTGDGDIVGTPKYMAPEQRAGGDVDARTDVFALGVMLADIAPERDRDLEAIVAHAAAERPENRYPSAAALAADLRRHARHEPVEARRASGLHHLRLFARRRTGVVLALAGLVAAVAAGIAFTLLFAYRAEEARKREQHKSYVAAIAAADAALRIYDVTGARRHLAGAPAELRAWEWRYLDRSCDRSVLVRKLPGISVDWMTRGPDGHLHCVTGGKKDTYLTEWSTDGDRLRHRTIEGGSAYALSPDGERIAVGAHDGTITVRRLRDDEEIAKFEALPHQVKRMLFVGDRLLTRGGELGTFVWDWRAGKKTKVLPDWSHDFARGKHGVVVAAHDHVVFLDADWRERSRTAVEAPTHVACWNGLAATGGRDQTVRIWDEKTGRLLREMRQRAEVPTSLDFAGGVLAVGFRDGTVTRWNPHTGVEVKTVWGHEFGVVGVCLLGGERCATAARDTTIRFWDLAQPLRETVQYRSAAFSPDGRWIAMGCLGCGLRIHDGETGRCVRKLLPGSRIQSVAFAPDGNSLFVADGVGLVRVVDPKSWKQVAEVRVSTGLLSLACTDERIAVGLADDVVVLDRRTLAERARFPVGHWPLGIAFVEGDIVVARQDGELLRLNPETGRRRWSATVPDSLAAVAVSPDGARLVTSAWDGSPRWWDAATGTMLKVLPGRNGWAATYSPDGTRIAVGGLRVVSLVDATNGQRVLTLHGFGSWAHGLAFSPDGLRLAAAGEDGWFHTYDARPRR